MEKTCADIYIQVHRNEKKDDNEGECWAIDASLTIHCNTYMTDEAYGKENQNSATHYQRQNNPKNIL